MKTIYKILIPLIILVVSYFYVINIKYEIYEVTADNIDKLKQLENVNIFQEYHQILPHYKGFASMQYINYGIKNEIEYKDNYYAKYKFSKGENESENYRIRLVDCTIFMVECKVGNVISEIHQRGDIYTCPQEPEILQKRIDYLKLNGFIEKESILKNGKSILIRDSNPYYFYIVSITADYENKPIYLTFKTYSKNKFPQLKI